jgi:hypothetical protein
MRRSALLAVVFAMMLATLSPAGASAGGTLDLALFQEAEALGFNEHQIDIIGSHAWDVRGMTQSYGYADDPLGDPGLTESDVIGTNPTYIGMEYVRYTDPSLLPATYDEPTQVGNDLFVPFGTGGIELNTDYIWFWGEFDDAVPYENPRLGLNFAFPFQMDNAVRYDNQSFPGDSWIGASHTAYLYNEPSESEPGALKWFAGLFTGEAFFMGDEEIPGGLAWICGPNIGFLVPAAAVQGEPDQKVVEYGLSLDVTPDALSRFDLEALRRVSVFPGNYGSDGRAGGLAPVTMERTPLNVGFNPMVDASGIRLFYNNDSNMSVWAEGWPTTTTTPSILNMYFSLGLQWGVGFNSSFGPFLGSEWHDGVQTVYGSGPDGKTTPMGIYVLNDGSLNIDLGIAMSDIESYDSVSLNIASAFWVDETTTERQFTTFTFPYTTAEIEDGDPTGDGSTTYATFDIVTNSELAPPAWVTAQETTTTSTTTTTEATEETTSSTVGDSPSEPATEGGGFPFIVIFLIALIGFLIWWFMFRPRGPTTSTTGGGTVYDGSGTRTRPRGGTPLSSIPRDHDAHDECGWGLYLDDGTQHVVIREPGKDEHLCCKYIVKVVTRVPSHAQARKVRQDDGDDRLRLVDLDYAWNWVDFSAHLSTRSGPAGRLDWMQGLGDPTEQSDIPSDPYYQEGPEEPELAAHLSHWEITDVSVTLEAGCPEYVNHYGVSAETALDLLATQECTNDAGDPCPVELNAFGFVGGWIMGPGDISTSVSDWTSGDPDELERTGRVAERMDRGLQPRPPGDSHDHVERDRAAYEVSDNDVASDGFEQDDISITIETEFEMDAGQTVPNEVWPTTERVTTHFEGDIRHDLQISAKLTPEDCDKNNCGGHGDCNCNAEWNLDRRRRGPHRDPAQTVARQPIGAVHGKGSLGHQVGVPPISGERRGSTSGTSKRRPEHRT